MDDGPDAETLRQIVALATEEVDEQLAVYWIEEMSKKYGFELRT